MPTNVLVVYYSSYGHIHQTAQAVAEGAERPGDGELLTARNLGSRVAKVAERLKSLRQTEPHGQQPESPQYEGE